MDTVPLSQARRDLPSLIDRVADHAVAISRHGSPVAVLISPSRYEELLSAQEDLEDLGLIEASLEDKTPSIPWEQVKRELGL